MIEYYKENGINGECRYGLACIESCRQCLFDTLCHLEHEKERKEKEKSDLSDNE